MRKFTSLLFAFILAQAAFAQAPVTWQTAFNQLQPKLQSINAQILSRWDGQKHGTAFSEDLSLANSNRGYELINPATQSQLLAAIDSMLSAFDFVGLRTIGLTIQYPMFVEGFPNRDKYLQFYENVVQLARARHFTILLGCQATFVDSVFGEPNLTNDVKNFYIGLNSTRYKTEKTQMLQTIIDRLAPDYLTVEMEPQAMTINLLQLVDFQADSMAAYTKYFLRHVNEKNTQIGAGAGTWDDFVYFEKLAQTGIDFIDYHIYPPHFNYVDDMVFKIDSLARAHNKDLVIGEAWCYKATNAEITSITNPVATSAEIYSRDMFDYWIPIDTLFIKALVNLSHFSRVKVTSFFWPTLLYGYLTYNPAIHGNMSFSQKLRSGQQAGFQRMLQKQLSPAGAFLQKQIAAATAVTEKPAERPAGFALAQNYPNPFSASGTLGNSATVISFQLSVSSHVTLKVFEVNGREVATLVDDEMTSGNHAVTFAPQGGDLAGGVYFYQLTAGKLSQTRKALLMK